MSEAPILVTGASGNTGREVLRALGERALPFRAGVRRPSRPSEIALDFRDRDTWDDALHGCRGAFLLRPPAIADVEDTLLPFVDRARALGAAQIVFLSVAGAENNRFVPHHAVEAHLLASDAPFTILRPGFFAQNLQDAYLPDIRDDDRLYVPAGRGRAAFVDLHDVADVAAAVFADPAAHDRAAYTLTGPEPLSFDEVAQILSEELGRPIRYEPASVPAYLRHLRRRGLGWGHALVQTTLHVLLRLGQSKAVDPTLERLLGRPGRTLRTYVRANAQIWARERGT
jgi:uncharacterized protein YbjT (DUF2867 family)